MADMDDDVNLGNDDNETNKLIASGGGNPASMAPQDTNNLNDVRGFFNQAKQDLSSSRQGGVTQEDLDNLHSHEASNMWTSLFMNLIGAAGGVDASKYTKPFQTRLDQERQGLALKNQLAQQSAQRAMQEQNFGMDTMKANQALSDQERLNSPLTPVQQNIKKSLSQFTNTPDEEITTQREFEQAFPQFAKLGQLQNERQNTLLKQQAEGWHNTQDSAGNPVLFNAITNEKKYPLGTSSSIDPSKTYNFNDLEQGTGFNNVNQKKDFMNNFKPIQKEASSIAKEQNDYESDLNDLKTFANMAYQGNYVAGRTLPDKEVRTIAGLKQRISNMQVQMQKDPATRGLAGGIESKLKEISGSGNVTSSDLYNLLDLANSIDKNRKQMYENEKNRIRQQASSLLPDNMKINLDQKLFGTSGNSQTPSNSNVTKFSSLDDYKNSLNNGGQ